MVKSNLVLERCQCCKIISNAGICAPT